MLMILQIPNGLPLDVNNNLIIQYGKIDCERDSTNTIYFPIVYTTMEGTTIAQCCSGSTYTQWTNGHSIASGYLDHFVLRLQDQAGYRCWLSIGY